MHATTAYEDRYLYEARLLFRMLFTNSVLGIDDHKITYDLISKKNTRLRRLELKEVQMGIFMCDLLYSKAREVSFPRIILHSITFLSSVSALVAFSTITTKKNVYSNSDTMLS